MLCLVFGPRGEHRLQLRSGRGEGEEGKGGGTADIESKNLHLTGGQQIEITERYHLVDWMLHLEATTYSTTKTWEERPTQPLNHKAQIHIDLSSCCSWQMHGTLCQQSICPA